MLKPFWDDDKETRYHSKSGMVDGMWLEVEFPHKRLINKVVFDAEGYGGDYPRSYRIQISEDGDDWLETLEGKGSSRTVVEFDETIALKVRITVTENAGPKWWTISELDIAGPTEDDVSQYPIDKREYLTLEAASRIQQGWSDPKQDRSVLNNPLRITRVEYKHGIGTHSYSEIVYNLEEKPYDRFFAKCGVDDGANGNLGFAVHLDSREVFASGNMVRGDKPKVVDVNVAGVKELKLIVTLGEDNKSPQDHPDWVDACFIKGTGIPSAPTFVKNWKLEELASDAANLTRQSAARGRVAFIKARCIQCHKLDGMGFALGPDLTDVAKRFRGAKLLQQILEPSAEINKKFQAAQVLTADGKFVAGVVVNEDDNVIHLVPNLLDRNTVIVVEKDDIEERFPVKLSSMPNGLLDSLTKEEILDLLAYLQD